MVQIIKKKFLPLALVLALILTIFFVSVSTAYDLASAPTITAFSPADGATVNSQNIYISFTVTDPDRLSVANTIFDADSNYSGHTYASPSVNDEFYVKINGNVIKSTLTYQGHWEGDEWGTWYVEDNYTLATVSALVTGLKDGLNTVEVQAKDMLGNPVSKTWTFKVAIPPTFSVMTPAPNSSTVNNNSLSVKVADDSQVDPASIKLTIDGGTPVQHNFDPATGIVSYAPQPILSDGSHNIGITAADLAGNIASTSWAYIVQANGPNLTFVNAGQAIPIYNPTLSVQLSSNVKLSDTGFSVTIDSGSPLPATFTYKGFWTGDEWGTWYQIESYNEGTLSFNSGSLSDGNHLLTVTAKDTLGNVSTKSWNFTITQPPVISGVEPTGIVTSIPNIKANITDPNGSPIDQTSIKLLVDNKLVIPNITELNGTVTVSYSDSALADDSYHDVNLTVADKPGNSTSKSWSFYGSIIGTVVFSNQAPQNITLNTATPTITAHLTNLGGTYNMNQVTMSINGGTPIYPTLFGTNPEYKISYTPTTPLKDGKNTVTLSVPDTANPTTPCTNTWSFDVQLPPVIVENSISPDYPVTNTKPTISAYTRDNGEVARAEMTLDGQAVTPQIEYVQSDNSGGRAYSTKDYARVSYVPAAELTQGTHNVSLKVYDNTGNSVNKQWSFNVDTNVGADFPDMPAVNDATCWKCHPAHFGIAASQWGSTVNGGKHPEVKACYGCHATGIWTSYNFKYCTNCHYGNTQQYSIKYLSYRHTSDGSYAFANLPYVRHPLNDKHLSTTTGCQECHSRILTKEHYRPERKDKNGNAITCDTCHIANYLGQEVSTDGKLKIVKTQNYQIGDSGIWYAPAGTTVGRIYIDTVLDSYSFVEIYALYKGQNGNDIWQQVYPRGNPGSRWFDLPQETTALKTHIFSPYAAQIPNIYVDVPKVQLVPNSDPFYQRIQNAITHKDTRCEACHDLTGHEELHVQPQSDQLDVNCQTCHKTTLTQEHTNNATTAGKNYNCNTCHTNTSKEVERTIAANNLNCAGCHTVGHNLKLGEKVPADIPLFPGFEYSTPNEATVFMGDANAPSGYDEGQLVLSNRRSDVNLSQLWDFYNLQLTNNKWLLKSGAPAAGATAFIAEFVKDKRYITVKVYNTSNSSNTGDALTSGYRTEIWYALKSN